MAQLARISKRSSMMMNFLRLNSSTSVGPKSDKVEEDPNVILSNKTHKVNDFERRLLVWTGKYKTKEEIPNYVAPEQVEKARNKFRIRTANIMMLLTLIGCGFMVASGKKAAEKGESVLKLNQDWHKEYEEKTIEELKAKAGK